MNIPTGIYFIFWQSSVSLFLKENKMDMQRDKFSSWMELQLTAIWEIHLNIFIFFYNAFNLRSDYKEANFAYRIGDILTLWGLS